jgi:predicted permease
MFGRFRKTDDFNKEIEAHLLLEADRLREQGLSEEDALIAARRLFGNPTRSAEQFYESRHWSFLGMLVQDLRFGLRILGKNLGTTLVTILTLAFALGVNTAIFSVLDAALLRSLPVRNANKLVILSDPNASMVLGGLLTGERSLLTFPEFSKLRDRMQTVSGLCASELTLERWPVQVAGSQEQVRGRLVSENYFSVFAMQPALGRFFTQNDAVGVGRDPYAVVSYDYWQRRFGGSTAIVGTAIRLRRTPVVIIGVAAKGFRGETVGQEPDLWLPMLMQPLVTPAMDGLKDTLGESQDKLMWLHVFGLRKTGVTIAQVQAEVSVLFRAILEADYPATMPTEARKEALQQHIAVKPLQSGAFHGRREFSEQWVLLLGLAGLVLLVACANIANLLLARAAARTQEVAIRLSIGAAKTRLIGQFMTESLLLAILGSAGGIIVAELVMHALSRMLLESSDALAISPSLDLHVLGYSATVTLFAAILFGLAPALRVLGDKTHENLKEGGRGAIGSRHRMTTTRGLVVAQIALSLLLAIGAGLFLRTLWNLQSVPLGYPRDNLLLIQVDSMDAGYRGGRIATLYLELARQIRNVPGVRAVSYSDRGLFTGFEGSFPIGDVDGFVSGKEEDRGSTGDSAGPGYFSTVGIPILLGREFSLRDMTKLPRFCVINEAFAQRFFPGVNPIGKHLTSVLSDQDGNSDRRRLEVIGVAGDARVQSMRGRIDPKFYVAGGGSWFEIRTAGDPNRLLRAARKAILAVDPDLTIQSAKPLTQVLAMQNAQPELIARLATFFGILALVLSAVGVYALLSYGVVRRTNEIGIRVALGADRSRIVGMIFKETALMMVVGIIGGLTATAVGAHLFVTQLYGPNAAGPRWSLARYEQVDSAAQLFGLNAMDPLTIGAAVGILCALGLMAGYLPALRAARVDPVQSLRSE